MGHECNGHILWGMGMVMRVMGMGDEGDRHGLWGDGHML